MWWGRAPKAWVKEKEGFMRFGAGVIIGIIIGAIIVIWLVVQVLQGVL